MNLVRFFAAAALIIVFPAVSNSATLFSTLSQLDNYFTSTVFSIERLATDFRTGTDASTVTLLSLPIRNQDAIVHNWRAAIHADSGGKPGSPIGEFDNTVALPARETAFTTRTFSSIGLNLSADSNYWIVFRQLEHGTSSSTDVNTVGNFANGIDAGSTYSAVAATPVKRSGNSGATWPDFAIGNLKYALEGTAVPEPATLALLIIAAMLVPRDVKRGQVSFFRYETQ